VTDSVTNIGRLHATLPRREGGAGLTPLRQVLPCANFASMVASWSFLSQRALVPDDSVPEEAASAITDIDPEEGAPSQHRLVQGIHAATKQQVSDSITTSQLRLRESNLSPTMQSAWLPYGPRVPRFSAGEWQILCRSRLLVNDVPDDECPRCGEYHHSTGHHKCNFYYRRIRHDRCRDAICKAVAADFAVETEKARSTNEYTPDTGGYQFPPPSSSIQRELSNCDRGPPNRRRGLRYLLYNFRKSGSQPPS